jgi:hypothetical protein
MKDAVYDGIRSIFNVLKDGLIKKNFFLLNKHFYFRGVGKRAIFT